MKRKPLALRLLQLLQLLQALHFSYLKVGVLFRSTLIKLYEAATNTCRDVAVVAVLFLGVPRVAQHAVRWRRAQQIVCLVK